jgi:deoxyadenosine/deoxycytidine kinase
MRNSIIIDGNIGSGKTTVIRSLQSSYDCIEEPVEEWAPYLKAFYEDMKKNALLFQMKVLQHHMTNSHHTNLKILERSALSCIDVFGKKLYDDGILGELDIKLMNELNTQYGSYPRNIIYINTPPELCYKRICERARSNEVIPMEYLKSISELYDNLYINKNNNIKIENLYIVDGTRDRQDVEKEVRDIIENLI